MKKKTYSVLFAAIIICIISSGSLKAQKPVKTDLLPFFEKVTPPPATSKYAYEKTFVKFDEYGNPVYNSEKLFKELNDQLDLFVKEINATVIQDNMPTQDQMDMAKQMQDPKFREKLKNMSQQEKVKWAMEMAKNSTNKATIETPEVTKAFQDASELTQDVSNDFQKFNETYKIDIDHQVEIEKKHNEINDWVNSEIDKLPNLSTGEMSYKDAKAVHDIKLKGAEKHISVENEELKLIESKWADLKTKYKMRCSPFNESLAKCHYGDDAKNKGMVKTFATAQQFIINSIIDLIAKSKNAYNEAARYNGDKVKLENEKVD